MSEVKKCIRSLAVCYLLLAVTIFPETGMIPKQFPNLALVRIHTIVSPTKKGRLLPSFFRGRSDWIRTNGLCVPNATRYQLCYTPSHLIILMLKGPCVKLSFHKDLSLFLLQRFI